MSDLAWAILVLGLLFLICIGAVLLALHDYGQQRRDEEPHIHTGRIWRTASGWWHYTCRDCDYRAGCAFGGEGWHWLMRTAAAHADPNHWSRRKQG